jgi:threonine dehydrogenase-like Zn-dependent dehydrogenase
VVTYTEGDFEAVIDAIATGKIQPKGMITKVIGVDQVDEGFKALVDDKDNQVKILIHVGKLREGQANGAK